MTNYSILIFSLFIFQLEILNLGNNQFTDLPEALLDCISLIKLHLFGNQLQYLSPQVLGIKT